MLARARKHADRAGLRPVHVNCALVVNTLHVPEECCIPEESMLCITFSKGKKSASTENFILKKREMTIKERLEMTVVLYQDVKTRRFQTKDSKLVLRQLCKRDGDVQGKSCHKDIGRCNLELNEIANEMGPELTKMKNGTVIFENLNGVMVKFSLTLTALKMDQASPFSSVVNEPVAAVACKSQGSAHGITTEEHESTGIQPSASEDTVVPGWAGCEVAVPIRQEETVTAAPDPNIPGNTAQPSPTSTDHAPPRSEGLTERVSGVTDSEQSSFHGSSQDKAIDNTDCDPRDLPVPTGCEDVWALYNRELAVREDRIAELEAVLADNRQEAEDQLERLQAELKALSATLAEERASRAASTAPADTDLARLDLQESQLLQALLQSRQETATATARYTATLADLEETTGALHSCREELSALWLQLREEMALTQQAARVASEACAQRAEAEDENRQLVSALVDMKMACAEVSTELDKLRKENADLQRQLHRYCPCDCDCQPVTAVV